MKLYIVTGIIACCILSSGCAYLGHRGRDFTDMFTLAVEKQNRSGDVRILFPLGFSFSEGKGFGLREGYWGSYEYTEKTAIMPLFFPGFELDFSPKNDFRKKAYLVRSDENDDPEFWSQCFSVQASIGIHYGLRAGLNVDEVLDFVLGWTTLDILGDDRSTTTNSVYKAIDK